MDFDLEFVKAKETFKRVQWMPHSKIKKRIEAKLELLITHAYENIPLYRQLYQKSGLSPRDFTCLEDLQLFPPVNKSMLRQGFPSSVTANNIPRCRWISNATSGSTGEPLRFYMDAYSLPLKEASASFFLDLVGINPWKCAQILLVGRYTSIKRPEIYSTNNSFHLNPLSNLRLRLKKTRSLVRQGSLKRVAWEAILVRFFKNRRSGLIMAEEISQKNVEKIQRYMEYLAPYWLLGYSSLIAFLAKEIVRQRINLQVLPKAIVCTSETLTPIIRNIIDVAYASPIYDMYGTSELGGSIAFSCPKTGKLHVNSELVNLETVKPDGAWSGPGNVGKIVITDLNNFVMPFIRYSVGDTAVLGECDCGRGLPVIHSLEGRTNEQVHTPSGKIISSANLSFPWTSLEDEYIDFIQEFQFIQLSENRIDLLIVPYENISHALKKKMMSELECIFDGMEIIIKEVSEIPVHGSGKRPIIRSEISEKYWSR